MAHPDDVEYSCAAVLFATAVPLVAPDFLRTYDTSAAKTAVGTRVAPIRSESHPPTGRISVGTSTMSGKISTL